MAIEREMERWIAAAWSLPREREWVAERLGVKHRERDRLSQRLAAMQDVAAAERDDVDRLAIGARGLVRRIAVGEDEHAREHRELCDAVELRDALVAELSALDDEIGRLEARAAKLQLSDP